MFRTELLIDEHIDEENTVINRPIASSLALAFFLFFFVIVTVKRQAGKCVLFPMKVNLFAGVRQWTNEIDSTLVTLSFYRVTTIQLFLN